MVEKEYVTSADLDYMRNQSDSEFGQMIYGMSSLLKENVSKLEVIRNQGWFKRMWNTVSGSNSVTLKLWPPSLSEYTSLSTTISNLLFLTKNKYNTNL